MFVGRESELAFLNKQYEKQGYGCIILYGRRRVGKTALINEFCKDKAVILFSAVKGSENDNLRELSRVISEYQYGMEENPSLAFSDLRSAFAAISRLAKDKRIVFCIDELPYLAVSIPSSLSVLQHFLDYEAKESGLFVILSGSSMSFMEDDVLAEKSPIYGRRTAQIKLEPFDYRETARWFPDYSYEDKALLYGITGGVPYYMECFLGKNSIREAVIDSILSTSGILFSEPSFLLREELKDSFVYDSLLRAVADGRTRLSEIADSIGMATGACSPYLKSLIGLGFIGKESPIGEASRKKTFYRLDDFFLRFWFRFVYKYASVISSGRGAELYDKIIASHLNEYMGSIFERMAKDYIMKYSDCPFLIGSIGRWWGGNHKTRRDAEIDIVAVSAENPDEGIIGSCKYRNRLLDVDELDLMKEYGDTMNLIRTRHYWLFSKDGFTEALCRMASAEVILIALKDMY